MRFKIYRQHGALNSPPIFDALELGLRCQGHDIVHDNEDVAVIWSVLWSGRMRANQTIYAKAKQDNKPVLIIEVGNLRRNHTWRISLNNINAEGQFGNKYQLDVNRPRKLDVALKQPPDAVRGEILVACQHQDSLQWQNMPTMRNWAVETIDKIKQHTNRRIIVRPHPRSVFPFKQAGVLVELPSKLAGSYDDFDINYAYHCVINHNSGPAVQASINGIPVLCDTSSLAAPLSISWAQLDNPVVPDREQWFLELCHTEWSIEEIAQGVPIARIFR